MACSSCGGGQRVYTVTDASGQQQPKYVSKTRYVWRWTSKDGSETKIFEREGEAYEYAKANHGGSIQIVSATPG